MITGSQGANIRIFGPRALKLVEEARRIRFSGIGLSQESGTPHTQRFIHLDNKPRKAFWSY